MKAAAIQAKARNNSGVGGQRPKAPSNMDGNTKKAKEAKEASKKVRPALAMDAYLRTYELPQLASCFSGKG